MNVWIPLLIVLVGVPVLIGHFGAAAYVGAGFLILAASIIRLHAKAAQAQYVGNQAAAALENTAKNRSKRVVADAA